MTGGKNKEFVIIFGIYSKEYGMEMQQVNAFIGFMTALFAMDDIVQTPDDDFFVCFWRYRVTHRQNRQTAWIGIQLKTTQTLNKISFL